MPRELPAGTVTFLFTDVEGSTKLLHELGAERYGEALAEHRRALREAFAASGGVEVDTQGDAFFVAFSTAPGAVAAAATATEALSGGRIRVRIGIHTGRPHLTEEGYVGEDVHLGARIAASGHGGQTLLSQATRDALEASNSLLLDLGEHRLKDFDQPVWIYQLGSDRFPPLKTISNTNLPRPASTFVGREREVEEVRALLSDGARLLTLSGPGGSGKTRLALETAAELVPEFRNGTFWVGLAPLRDPGLVGETIAQTLGAQDGLAEHVGERELLLLLDNFEHVVEAAPKLASLVEACPNLRVLVTSRELLRVRGEVEYAVPPLADPEAARLFCTRAQLEPSGEIAELCRRLDNLPLAVELAAARTKVLTPAQILERLSARLDLLKGGRDAEARQQTLRATIEWSHELLDDAERRLFARLAVFAGGCTLEAAGEVCDADLDVLQSLVDKSLLRRTGERFWMLETIREYAAERLEASGEAEELRGRLADSLVRLGEEGWPHLREASREWFDLLEREHDNVRAAFDWLEASGRTQELVALAGAIAPFWDMREYHTEGRERVERALRADPAPTPARARALVGASMLAADQADAAGARSWGESALALYRELGDEWGIAYALFALGFAEIYADPELARQRWAEATELFTEVGDDWQTLDVRRRLSWAYENLGDHERARELREENLELARTTGNRLTEAATLGQLARQHVIPEGRLEDAAEMIRQSARIHHELAERWGAVLDVGTLARILACKRDAKTAALLLACEKGQEEAMDFSEPWFTAFNEETRDAVLRYLDRSTFAEAWQQGLGLTVDEAVALAFAAIDRLSAAPRAGT